MSKLDPPEIRTSLIERINGALANIELASKRVADAHAKRERALQIANSEVGTAEAELGKLQREYNDLRLRLVHHLPNPNDVAKGEPLEHQRSRERADTPGVNSVGGPKAQGSSAGGAATSGENGS